MLELLKQFVSSRGGLTVVLLAAAGLVGTSVVSADSAEGKSAGLAGAALVAVGVAALVPKVLAWVKSKGGEPPAPPPVGPAL